MDDQATEARIQKSWGEHIPLLLCLCRGRTGSTQTEANQAQPPPLEKAEEVGVWNR